MEPEQYSIMKMYGDREFFEKKMSQGYTQVAFGSGKWIKGERIVGIFAFYHPNGRVATLETPKCDFERSTVRGKAFEDLYWSPKTFGKHVLKKQITMSDKTDLTDIVNTFNQSA